MATRSEKFKTIAEEARSKTNATLDNEIGALTTITAEDLSRIIPTKADKEKFAELMSIVSASTAENIRAAKLIKNIDDLGEIVVRVLKKTIV